MRTEDSTGDPERVSVLVVDDTPANLVALGAVLGPLEVRIVEAHSGPEAIARASEESFAVALLDVQMPEMDGFEVARRLRETATGVELPIIFLTAIHRDEAYARRGYATGAADYITKPYDPEVLRARVKAFVDLFQQRERLRRAQVGERTRERDEALEKQVELLASERAARREAEIANRAKDEFLATISHELRTPLSAILGWAVIARQKTTSPDVERALTTIERNARAQMRIIEDMLDVGRIVSGKLQLEFAATDVADAIEGAAQAVRPAADAKQVDLAVAIDADVGVIAADAERLQQIVWNLLSNAIKFTPKGGHVTLSARRTESSVVVHVSDDGQGIRAEFLPYLFEPFRQADGSTTRRHGGLGLGLAIVKQLVDAHGGAITAHSEGDGRGASFTLELPARTMPAPSRDRSRPGAEQDAATPIAPRDIRLDGLRLLIVDDDEDSRDLIGLILEGQGATVASASSAGEALRLFADSPPDVLVSDIGMPNVNGYSLIRRVRALSGDRGGRTPAIALTAYARAEDGERAFAAGFQAHVTKPIDPDRLTAIVANLAGIPLDPASEPSLVQVRPALPCAGE
jgi:signal transduction histidine kinase